MIDRLLKQFWFPVLFQIVTLGAFTGLVLLGWDIFSRDSRTVPILRYTNFANLVVWHYWWPLVILGAILAGRLWCVICPMELIQNVLNRFSLKLEPPQWLKSGWLITILYGTVLIIGLHTFTISQVPQQMAFYLLTLFGLTLFFTLIFEKRTFCSHVCPVGHLLGLCSTAAITELRVRDRSVCNSCQEKPCINKKRNNSWYGRSCQSNIFPGAIKDNRDCILCTQCIKACPQQNVTFRFRKPFGDLFQGIKLKNAQAAFLVIVLGFAFYDLATEWQVVSTRFMTPLNRMHAALNIPPQWTGTMDSLLLFFILPAIIFLLFTALASLLDQRRMSLASLSENLIPFIPIMATTLMAKAIIKPISRLHNVLGSLSDPFGLHTAYLQSANIGVFVGMWQYNFDDYAHYIASGILAIGFIITVFLIIRMPREKKRAATFLLILLALAYVSITFGAMVGSALEPNILNIPPWDPC